MVGLEQEPVDLVGDSNTDSAKHDKELVDYFKLEELRTQIIQSPQLFLDTSKIVFGFGFDRKATGILPLLYLFLLEYFLCSAC